MDAIFFIECSKPNRLLGSQLLPINLLWTKLGSCWAETTTKPPGKVADLIKFFDNFGKATIGVQPKVTTATTAKSITTTTTPRATSSAPTVSTPFSYAQAAGGKAPSPTPVAFIPTSSTTPKPEIASDDELKTFSEAVLQRDVNNAAKYIKINLQEKTKPNETSDPSPLPLLEVNPEAYRIPTIAKLKPLLDNYERDVLVNEFVSPLEKNEENEFLDAIIATPIMTHTKTFLIEKGIISRDPKEFKDLLRKIWFGMYSRGGGKLGSSGFEHVFLTEKKKNEVQGLHNWIYFTTQEASKNLNYYSYTRSIDLGDKGSLLKVHFKYDDLDKPTGSLFVGTSPEFEMSLYTVCYLVRPNRRCPLRLNGKKMGVKAFTMRYRSDNYLGSAFAEI